MVPEPSAEGFLPAEQLSQKDYTPIAIAMARKIRDLPQRPGDLLDPNSTVRQMTEHVRLLFEATEIRQALGVPILPITDERHILTTRDESLSEEQRRQLYDRLNAIGDEHDQLQKTNPVVFEGTEFFNGQLTENQGNPGFSPDILRQAFETALGPQVPQAPTHA